MEDVEIDNDHDLVNNTIENPFKICLKKEKIDSMNSK